MIRLLIGALWALALVAGQAAAQTGDVVVTGHAETRLAAENVAAAPGETVTLALMQELEDHWHVYWRNPGDSGLPPERQPAGHPGR